MPSLSIIIPVLNEESYLNTSKKQLASLLEDGHEILVVDGGSQDDSKHSADALGCKVFSTRASRGHQLHHGAKHSTYDILLFLHADTLLPPDAAQVIAQALAKPQAHWGRFNVRFTNPRWMFRVIAWFMNKRSCLTGIVTGDHALFIKRELYFSCGGFMDLPIMEDVEFCRRLKKNASPVCLSEEVVTSSRRWEQSGILKTVITMWALRLLFFFGRSPEKLARLYK